MGVGFREDYQNLPHRDSLRDRPGRGFGSSDLDDGFRWWEEEKGNSFSSNFSG